MWAGNVCYCVLSGLSVEAGEMVVWEVEVVTYRGRRHCSPRCGGLPISRNKTKERHYTKYTCREKCRSKLGHGRGLSLSLSSLPRDRTKAIERGDPRTTCTTNCLTKMRSSCGWVPIPPFRVASPCSGCVLCKSRWVEGVMCLRFVGDCLAT